MAKKEKFGLVLPIVLISYFMILLDNSVVFTSTVKISQDLQMGRQALSWVSNAYILTFGGLLLLGGRLGDIYGRKKIFAIGLTIFSTASLLVGLAVNSTMIIAMRAIQGVGSAIIAPATLALLMDNYQGQMLQRGVVYYGATAGLGASMGLLIGGLIASFISWRVGFLINVPIGIVMILLTVFKMKDKSQRTSASLDLWGAILSVVGMTALVYAIDGQAGRWPSLILALIALTVFMLHERRSKTPLMPLKLYVDPERRNAYLARFFFAGIAITFLYLTPQALQDIYHFTPLTSALAFFLQTIPQFITAMLVNRLLKRFSNAAVMIWGLIATIVGLVMLGLVGIQRGFEASLPIPMILVGIGQGLAFSPLTNAGIANVTDDIAGSASSVVNVVHQIGSSVGLSITIALTSGISSQVAAYNNSTWILVVLAVISLIFCCDIARITKN